MTLANPQASLKAFPCFFEKPAPITHQGLSQSVWGESLNSKVKQEWKHLHLELQSIWEGKVSPDWKGMEISLNPEARLE